MLRGGSSLVADSPGERIPEGDGDTEAGEQQVGHHTDYRQRRHREQNQQRETKGRPRLLWLFPVNELYGWETGRAAQSGGVGMGGRQFVILSCDIQDVARQKF